MLEFLSVPDAIALVGFAGGTFGMLLRVLIKVSRALVLLESYGPRIERLERRAGIAPPLETQTVKRS